MINGTEGNDILIGDSQNNTINGFAGNDIILPGAGDNVIDGGDGVDTVSYQYQTAGVTVDLNNSIATRKFTTTGDRPFKILPLGDSNTLGYPGTSENGSYRTKLWTDLVINEGYNLDFVGLDTNGPLNIDRDHVGFGGFTIDDLTNNVNRKGKLNSSGTPLYTNIEDVLSSNPDMVLLMAGTNDMFQGNTVDEALNELGILVDRITTKLPDTKVLVASILPIKLNPELQAKSTEFSSRVEGEIVNPRIALNQKVSFVDIFNAPLNDNDFVDGIHLTPSGYDKLADIWRGAILNTIDGSETLLNIENIYGSPRDDLLIGNVGANTISGSDGNDILLGGGGNDVLTGELGNNLFVLAPGQGIDTITDFTVSRDRIGLANGLTWEQLSIVGGTDLNVNDSFITIANSGEILAVLSGVPATAIAPTNFVLV